MKRNVSWETDFWKLFWLFFVLLQQGFCYTIDHYTTDILTFWKSAPRYVPGLWWRSNTWPRTACCLCDQSDLHQMSCYLIHQIITSVQCSSFKWSKRRGFQCPVAEDTCMYTYLYTYVFSSCFVPSPLSRILTLGKSKFLVVGKSNSHCSAQAPVA